MVAVRFKICGVVGLLGFLALVSGVVAEVTRMQMNNVSFSDLGVYTCSYPKNVTTLPLGIFAALCVLVAQIIANAFGGCVCCWAANNTKNLPSESKRTAAILCLLFSWIVSISSLIWLLLFGLANVVTSNDPMITQQGCPTPYPGGLITGGILAMVGTILAIMFYLLATSKPNETEVVMPVSMPIATVVPPPHGGEATDAEVRLPVSTTPRKRAGGAVSRVASNKHTDSLGGTRVASTKHTDSLGGTETDVST